jgi:hypothetical protein
MDYTAITGAIDFSGVLTGVGAAAALLAAVYVARKGARMLLGFVK